MAQQNPNLTAADLAAIAKLPQASQVTGGINAFNQAAFGNPVAPTSQFGIVPTAPINPPAPPPIAKPPPPVSRNPPVSNGLPPGLASLGTVLNPGHFLPGAGGGFQTAGPKGDRNVLPVGHPSPYQAKQQANQEAIQKMLGLHPNLGKSIFGHPMQPPANHATPPKPQVMPAQQQHLQAAAQHLGIQNMNQSSLLGQKFHAPNQPPISVEGLNRVTQAYTTALANNPANHKAAQVKAAAHLDVERALSPVLSGRL